VWLGGDKAWNQIGITKKDSRRALVREKSRLGEFYSVFCMPNICVPAKLDEWGVVASFLLNFVVFLENYRNRMRRWGSPPGGWGWPARRHILCCSIFPVLLACQWCYGVWHGCWVCIWLAWCILNSNYSIGRNCMNTWMNLGFGFLLGLEIIKHELCIWSVLCFMELMLIWIKYELCHMRACEIVYVGKIVLWFKCLGIRYESK